MPVVPFSVGSIARALARLPAASPADCERATMALALCIDPAIPCGRDATYGALMAYAYQALQSRGLRIQELHVMTALAGLGGRGKTFAALHSVILRVCVPMVRHIVHGEPLPVPATGQYQVNPTEFKQGWDAAVGEMGALRFTPSLLTPADHDALSQRFVRVYTNFNGATLLSEIP